MRLHRRRLTEIFYTGAEVCRKGFAADMTGSNRILLVEDEVLIAMDIESHLIDHGFEVAGPCATIRGAMALAQESDLAAAILDVNLQGGQSFDLAKDLKSRKIPSVFISGAAEHDLPDDLSGCPVLVKPICYSGLLTALRTEISKAS